MLIMLSCCLSLMQHELDLCVSSDRWVSLMLLLMYAFNLPGSHIVTNAGLAYMHKIKPVCASTLDPSLL